jgi:hypothetical protein
MIKTLSYLLWKMWKNYYISDKSRMDNNMPAKGWMNERRELAKQRAMIKNARKQWSNH